MSHLNFSQVYQLPVNFNSTCREATEAANHPVKVSQIGEVKAQLASV
jgi:hypothetical protein